MEDILIQLSKDATGVKHANIRKACQETIELLKDVTATGNAEAHQLRERCLTPFQLALESRNSKLSSHAICGIQRLLLDERFHTSMETEYEDRWLPMQVLKTVWATPQLPDDTQVEVMKVLLNMTYTTNWCMNAKVITKMAELCLNAYHVSTKQTIRFFIYETIIKIVSDWVLHHKQASRHQVVLDTYGINSQTSVRTAVKATLTQLLTAIAEKLEDKQLSAEEESNNAIAEFTSNAEDSREQESLAKDVVGILGYLCDKLSACHNLSSSQQIRQTEPLLLEGIYAILVKIPNSMRENQDFIDLIWQRICPSLICIVGNPMTDKSVTSQKSGGHDELGRGSGCSTVAPSVHGSSAKCVYNIAVELVRLVGCFESLRPVLESVFHRMLLYPPPQHRLEALKAIREVLNKPERLVDLAGPTTTAQEVLKQTPKKTKRKLYSELGLLKLIIDSIQECCHCSETAVCVTSVSLVNDLLTSVEQLVKGQGISERMVFEMHRFYMEDGSRTSRSFSEDQNSVFTNGGEHTVSQKGPKSNGSETHDDLYSKSDSDTDSEECVSSNAGNRPAAPPPARHNSASRLHAETEIADRFLTSGKITNFEEMERASARVYVQELVKVLPTMLESYSTLEADELVQRFSSDICTLLTEQHGGPDGNGGVILNADGAYLATYSAILLNLKLINVGYYQSEEKSLPISEQQFIDEILNTGLLLFLSREWLSELFHQVIQFDLLGQAGFRNIINQDAECALVQLLTDIDGLESRKIGGQLLAAYRDRADAVTSEKLNSSTSAEITLAADAGMKFAHRIILVCWEGILDVLSVLIGGKSSCGITSSFALMFNAKEESLRAREAICASLDGLHKAARLACILGIQDRCGTVFDQLASGSCVVELEDLKREREKPDKKPAIPNIPHVLTNKPKLARLHAAHALSMDVVLGIGLEMGSHSADCWPHVLKCCAHIAELEHTYFSRGNNQNSLPKVQNEHTKHQFDLSTCNTDFDGSDLFNPVMVTSTPVAPTINVPELINQSSQETGWDNAVTGGGVLSAAQASKVLCGLSQEVDRLYEDAAHKLNMKSLVSFLAELCKSSQQQLAAFTKSSAEHGHLSIGNLPTNALHLYRLGDVMLKCLHSGRPLLHIMLAWSVVAPHFVEAACHRERKISKKAVNCIHEVVTTLLSSQPELAHFHFNESLCKPFENLISLELCDGDVQDQVVCSICELVEACTNEIRSGWRPLFGALRAVKIEYTLIEEVNEARQRHVAAVLDVFDVFLNTDNVLVFSNAAVDCILCLLKYVRGPGEFEDVADDDSDSGNEQPAEGSSENLCLPALKYLQQCCSILSSMWQMPACPIVNGAHRIKTDAMRCVDPVIPNMDLAAFQKPFLERDYDISVSSSASADIRDPARPDERGADAKSFTSLDSGIVVSNGNNADAQVSSPKDESKPKGEDLRQQRDALRNQVLDKLCGREDGVPLPTPGGAQPPLAYHCLTMEELDNHTGVLHVWFLVIEGLASTVVACPKNYQPQILETLFGLMRSASQVPGLSFALHCVNHLLLPTMQSWLRRGNQITGYWDGTTTANFKQCAGLCTDLVVEYIVQAASAEDQKGSIEFLLKQMLNILTECVAQPDESISRLGCACIRHCLLSSGPMLTERMWQIVCVSLTHAFDVTMHCMKQLMTPFHANSDNFYGDIGQVKVAVRKDCSGIECERLRLLAQQVFLLDSQRGTSTMIDYEKEEDRSYIFLIYSPEQKNIEGAEPLITRVPFKSVVVGLLSHQILVQTVGCLLLQGSSNMVPSERSMMPTSPKEKPGQQGSFEQEDSVDLIHDTPLPGMLKFMSNRNVLTLLSALKESYQMAANFDARPGLKFLIQKVAKAEVAGNLYKQAGISMTFYIHALMEICAHQDNICVDNTKQMLYEGVQARKAEQTTATDEDTAADDSQPNSAPHSTYVEKVQLARSDAGDMQRFMTIFVNMMHDVFNEVCTEYVDLYLDQAGPNAADKLSGQVLVFLLAQTEEICTLKRDKSLKEMVAEKLRMRSKEKAEGNQEVVTAFGDIYQVTPVQADYDGNDDDEEEEEEEEFSESSAPGSPQKEKINKQEDKVYTVATDKTIKNLMSQYKKRKQVHSMPAFVKQTRSKPEKQKKNKPLSSDPVERQIEEQQQSSIVKDSEAHLSSWIEMICNMLQLYHQLPDYQYRALLPIIFNCVTQFTCHCKAQRLREVLGQWTHRIGHMYAFAPPGDNPPPVPRPDP